MKKKIIILGIITIILITTSIITKFKDSARVRNNMEPIYTIKIVSYDGSKVTYWGLGYKVIRYPSISPNEPFKNNVGAKFGNWFMKYPIDKIEKEEIVVNEGENKLLYLGHASLRITTKEGKVIYIDPYMGANYDMPADLVLVTHGHYDHNDLSKIKNKDYQLITWKEALENGKHQTFNLEYAKIEAVEAGYNKNHSVTECVGYIITLSDGTKVYVAGDTSETPQMTELANSNIDYAFFPCDGIYNMNANAAALASSKVKAKHNIPYHTVSDGRPFDETVAASFNAENKLVIKPQEEIVITHE